MTLHVEDRKVVFVGGQIDANLLGLVQQESLVFDWHGRVMFDRMEMLNALRDAADHKSHNPHLVAALVELREAVINTPDDTLFLV